MSSTLSMLRTQPKVAAIFAAASALAMSASIFVLTHSGGITHLIRNAAGYNGKTVSGFGAVTKALSDLTQPAMIAMFAIAPLAIIVGGIVMATGNRKGIAIAGGAIGAAILTTGANGIIA